MKYSEDVEKRVIQMSEEISAVRKLSDKAPIGQLLNMLEVVSEEILEWSDHPDFTQDSLVGAMTTRIVDVVVERQREDEMLDAKFERF